VKTNENWNGHLAETSQFVLSRHGSSVSYVLWSVGAESMGIFWV